MPAKTRYVLIDYENVQPKTLAPLPDNGCNVIVFLGADQKVPSAFVEALQARGNCGRYFRIHGNGRNALDFHIAFHLGELVAAEPSAEFHIVSKDKDFDRLIEHVRSRGIAVERCSSLAAVIPVADDLLRTAVERLKGHGNRPNKRKSLAKTIANWFKQLEEAQVDAMVEALEKRGTIAVRDGKLAYRFE